MAEATDNQALATAPGQVLAEFERFRHKLGFSSRPAPLIADRYRLEQTLGRGAMGEVHLAHDHRLERSVALKLVRASSKIDADTLQARLEREALALARVDHPNVIGIHDVGSHADQTYFTMQFVAGTTLREWQAKHSKPEILAAYLQAARGLAAAHACAVVHRDFKPDNVIVGDDGLVRVLDFGIAAALRDEASGAAEPGSTPIELESTTAGVITSGTDETARSGFDPMTRAGTLLGTLPYMASEQLQGRRADARSDQFGFCVALWEALAGRRPFAGRSPSALLESIDAGPTIDAAIPRWIRIVLARGLAGDPAKRWPSMDALIDALERGRSRRRKLVLGTGLTLLVSVASVVGWAMAPAPELALSETCETFVASIDPLWSASQRAAISTRASVDEPSRDYVLTTLDALADDWRRAAHELCEGEAAPAKDSPARACLSAWEISFGDHVELLVERGDAKTLARAPDLLARLSPPSGDFCALRPARPIDPEVWRGAELARAAVVLGEIEQAFASADAALARAESLDPRAFTPDAAAAHGARAEVAAFAGERELALRELASTEQQALGAEVPELLLAAWSLEAKLLALGGDPDQAELALALVDRAEPLLFALELAELDPRRAELLEARGLAERGRGRPREAIALHRRAQASFVAAGQPTLAGKALINIGAAHQDLDEPEQARAAYAEALVLFDRAGLPPGYRNRIQLERNLALLAYASSEPEELAQGLSHFEFVVAHGSASERLEALSLIVALALELEDDALILRWSERALAQLEAQPEASVGERVGIQRSVGIALASAGDPRGEALLEQAERGAESLSLEVQFNLQRSWIQWLEDAGQCSAASERRAAFITRMADLPADEAPSNYSAWRDAGPDCTPSNSD